MDFKKKFKNLMNSKSKYVVLIGIVGILLIFLSTISSKKEPIKKEKTEKLTSQTSEEYIKQLEVKLNNIISKIEGVGRSEVLITMENGVENVYANSEKKTTNSSENISGKMSTRDDTQKDIVVIDTHEGKKALMVTQKEPTIKGVLVVCDGADNVSVVEKVTDAVSKSLNIKKNRLSVVKGV